MLSCFSCLGRGPHKAHAELLASFHSEISTNSSAVKQVAAKSIPCGSWEAPQSGVVAAISAPTDRSAGSNIDSHQRSSHHCNTVARPSDACPLPGVKPSSKDLDIWHSLALSQLTSGWVVLSGDGSHCLMDANGGNFCTTCASSLQQSAPSALERLLGEHHSAQQVLLTIAVQGAWHGRVEGNSAAAEMLQLGPCPSNSCQTSPHTEHFSRAVTASAAVAAATPATGALAGLAAPLQIAPAQQGFLTTTSSHVPDDSRSVVSVHSILCTSLPEAQQPKWLSSAKASGQHGLQLHSSGLAMGAADRSSCDKDCQDPNMPYAFRTQVLTLPKARPSMDVGFLYANSPHLAQHAPRTTALLQAMETTMLESMSLTGGMPSLSSAQILATSVGSPLSPQKHSATVHASMPGAHTALHAKAHARQNMDVQQLAMGDAPALTALQPTVLLRQLTHVAQLEPETPGASLTERSSSSPSLHAAGPPNNSLHASSSPGAGAGTGGRHMTTKVSSIPQAAPARPASSGSMKHATQLSVESTGLLTDANASGTHLGPNTADTTHRSRRVLLLDSQPSAPGMHLSMAGSLKPPSSTQQQLSDLLLAGPADKRSMLSHAGTLQTIDHAISAEEQLPQAAATDLAALKAFEEWLVEDDQAKRPHAGQVAHDGPATDRSAQVGVGACGHGAEEGKSIGGAVAESGQQGSPPAANIPIIDLRMVAAVHPDTAEPLLLAVGRDVSSQTAHELSLLALAEGQLAMMCQMFPRHVIEALAMSSTTAARAGGNRATTTTNVKSTMDAPAGTSTSQAEHDPHLNSIPSGKIKRHGSMAKEQAGDVLLASSSCLKPQQQQLARRHEDVTILFMDIAGYTSMSEQLEAGQVMDYINRLFSLFDALVDVHGVHKVETAGDCYIVSAGVVAPGADGFMHILEAHDPADSAARVMAFAKGALAAAAMVPRPDSNAPTVVRVGIHTGPCVSGLVGSRLPKFSVFGDTMNTASRMESTAPHGRIQVSAATHTLLPHEAWQPTGGVEVKGKAHKMETYLWAPVAEPLQGHAQPGPALLQPSDVGSATELVQGLRPSWPPLESMFILANDTIESQVMHPAFPSFRISNTGAATSAVLAAAAKQSSSSSGLLTVLGHGPSGPNGSQAGTIPAIPSMNMALLCNLVSASMVAVEAGPGATTRPAAEGSRLRTSTAAHTTSVPALNRLGMGLPAALLAAGSSMHGMLQAGATVHSRRASVTVPIVEGLHAAK